MNLVERLAEQVDLKFNGVWNRLAIKADIKPQTLQSIKQGTEPKAYTIYRISKALNVSTDWLLEGTDDAPERPSMPTDLREDILLLAIESIEEVLNQSDRAMTPKKKAQLVCAVYDLCLDLEVTSETKAKVLKFVTLAA